MILKVMINGQEIPVNVPADLVDDAETFFLKMDSDMSKGWQMSKDWVDEPNLEQRCQIAADRLLSAIHNDNTSVATMMAAYIMARMPGTVRVVVDTQGEIQETHFEQGDPHAMDS